MKYLKSSQFAEELGYKDFKGSGGFVSKFIKRNGLKFGVRSEKQAKLIN